MDEKLSTNDENSIATAPATAMTGGAQSKELGTVNNDVEKDVSLPTQSQATNQDIVDWEGEEDPAKPMNW